MGNFDLFIYFSFIHSFRSLSQTGPFLKVIKQLLRSSSLYSRYFNIFFCLSSSNMFLKTVPTQDVTNPISLSPFYCMQDIPLLRDAILHSLISHTSGLHDDLHPSAATYVRTFQVFVLYFPKCPLFSAIKCYAPHVALHQFLP